MQELAQMEDRLGAQLVHLFPSQEQFTQNLLLEETFFFTFGSFWSQKNVLSTLCLYEHLRCPHNTNEYLLLSIL